MARLRHLPPAPLVWEDDADVVVVGSGAAGLSAALAASAGRRVTLICKSELRSGSTPWAQGGLAAVTGPADSPASHLADTLAAGAGLCDEAAVKTLVAAAPGEITRLRALGADFDREAGGGLALGREGGHSHHRVVHAGGDASGAEVHRTLLAALRRAPVRVLEKAVALDVCLDERGRVQGLMVGLVGSDGRSLRVGRLRAAAVVLGSGGHGHAFATTTNPPGVTGDGLALALRAGAEVRDVEFVQFHPTVLWQGEGARGQQALVSEAVRGAGAVLVDDQGRSVMAGVHPLADLAPRDVVAAAMHAAMIGAPGGPRPHLWLDATGLGARLEHEFPTVVGACRAAGVDPVTEPIPVAPGAHYACGGVLAEMDGVTSVPGLFAVGEVAATGVHGANRLASNSVTEALVTGRRCGELLAAGGPAGVEAAAEFEVGAAERSLWGVAPSARGANARAMSRFAGVSRDAAGLEQLLDTLERVPPADTLDLEVVEATNLHTVSVLVATAALARAESRGCHRRRDLPGTSPSWRRSLVMRWDDGEPTVALQHGGAAA